MALGRRSLFLSCILTERCVGLVAVLGSCNVIYWRDWILKQNRKTWLLLKLTISCWLSLRKKKARKLWKSRQICWVHLWNQQHCRWNISTSLSSEPAARTGASHMALSQIYIIDNRAPLRKLSFLQHEIWIFSHFHDCYNFSPFTTLCRTTESYTKLLESSRFKHLAKMKISKVGDQACALICFWQPVSRAGFHKHLDLWALKPSTTDLWKNNSSWHLQWPSVDFTRTEWSTCPSTLTSAADLDSTKTRLFAKKRNLHFILRIPKDTLKGVNRETSGLLLLSDWPTSLDNWKSLPGRHSGDWKACKWTNDHGSELRDNPHCVEKH